MPKSIGLIIFFMANFLYNFYLYKVGAALETVFASKLIVDSRIFPSDDLVGFRKRHDCSQAPSVHS